jgi:hypothetical protein
VRLAPRRQSYSRYLAAPAAQHQSRVWLTGKPVRRYAEARQQRGGVGGQIERQAVSPQAVCLLIHDDVVTSPGEASGGSQAGEASARDGDSHFRLLRAGCQPLFSVSLLTAPRQGGA